MNTEDLEKFIQEHRERADYEICHYPDDAMEEYAKKKVKEALLEVMNKGESSERMLDEIDNQLNSL